MSSELVKREKSEMVAPPASLIEASLKLPPRDMAVVSDTLIKMATVSPEVARRAIYCVPVGKDKDTGLQKFKLGESIRLAEMGQGAFGRMMCDMHVEERTQNSVTVKAILLDLQTLNVYTGLGTATIFNESRAKLAIGAASSIARRNAILSMIRPYTNAILPQIKECIVRSLSAEGSVKEALEALLADFKALGVTEEQVKKVVANERDNVDRVVVLLGIQNAIMDNMVTVEEVFFGGGQSDGDKAQQKAARETLANRMKKTPQAATAAAQASTPAQEPAGDPVEADRQEKIGKLKTHLAKARGNPKLKAAWDKMLTALEMAPVSDADLDMLPVETAAEMLRMVEAA